MTTRSNTACIFRQLISIWCLNDKFVTHKWRVCYISREIFENPSTSTHFANSARRSRVVHGVSFLCGQQHPICLVYAPSFCKLHSPSKPTNKNLTHYKRGTNSTRHFRRPFRITHTFNYLRTTERSKLFLFIYKYSICWPLDSASRGRKPTRPLLATPIGVSYLDFLYSFCVANAVHILESLCITITII
jgi:hypothetical protein